MTKKTTAILLSLSMCSLLFYGCADEAGDTTSESTKESGSAEKMEGSTEEESKEESTVSKDNDSILSSLDAYAGYFEGDSTKVTVSCVSGTEGAYTLSGNTLTFTSLNENSVYSISGQLKGNIVIDIGDDYSFDLELTDFSLVSDSETPIVIKSADEVSLTAKKNTKNYIYDKRKSVGDASDSYSAAVYSTTDLKVCGKGSLTVISENNNGIHSKDDLKIKNLTLTVSCLDNALKGNDNVEITDADTTLIASEGDAIKTVSTKISSKGNQKGLIIISGGTHNIYAAKDGIDAAYDCQINNESTTLNIYTGDYTTKDNTTSDKKQDIPGSFPEDSPAFYKGNADNPDSMEKPEIPSGERPGNNKGPGGFGDKGDFNFPGGFGEDQNKPDESAKGIKTGNELIINDGVISIASGDDAIHSDGNVTINGGKIDISNSYEGIEGNVVIINDGTICLYSNDDGINGTSASETAVSINGGEIYIYCNGDGIDSNSRASGRGIEFTGGDVIIVSTSGRDSAIDTEQGYAYEGGRILAIMPENGMTHEVKNCTAFSQLSKAVSLSLNEGEIVNVYVAEIATAALKMPCGLNAYVVYLGSSDAALSASLEPCLELNSNEFIWSK